MKLLAATVFAIAAAQGNVQDDAQGYTPQFKNIQRKQIAIQYSPQAYRKYTNNVELTVVEEKV